MQHQRKTKLAVFLSQTSILFLSASTAWADVPSSKCSLTQPGPAGADWLTLLMPAAVIGLLWLRHQRKGSRAALEPKA